MTSKKQKQTKSELPPPQEPQAENRLQVKGWETIAQPRELPDSVTYEMKVNFRLCEAFEKMTKGDGWDAYTSILKDKIKELETEIENTDPKDQAEYKDHIKATRELANYKKLCEKILEPIRSTVGDTKSDIAEFNTQPLIYGEKPFPFKVNFNTGNWTVEITEEKKDDEKTANK